MKKKRTNDSPFRTVSSLIYAYENDLVVFVRI